MIENHCSRLFLYVTQEKEWFSEVEIRVLFLFYPGGCAYATEFVFVFTVSKMFLNCT